jgi:hypothetical protein
MDYDAIQQNRNFETRTGNYFRGRGNFFRITARPALLILVASERREPVARGGTRFNLGGPNPPLT